MSATEQNDEQQQPVVEGPGKLLRDIRVAREMDIVRVASLLHLDVELLESLEADDYDRMPETVFVQGYLRNYARLLDTPAEPILDAFRRFRPAGAAESDLSMRHIKPDVRSSHTLVRLITWLIVIGLLGLVFTWWRGYLQWPLDLGLQPAIEQPAGPESSQELPPVDGGLLPEQPIESEISPPMVIPDSVMQQPEPEMSVAGEQGVPGNLSPEVPEPVDSIMPEEDAADGAGEAVEMSTEVVPPSPSETDSPEALPVETAVTQSEPAFPVAGAASDLSVQVIFSDDCWTDIRDGSGAFRLIGNKRAGERLLLGGEPPYTMVFGNASAVAITVNGEGYDLTPHIRGNVARFTLNPES